MAVVDWNAVGSIATAATVLVALVAVYIELRVSRDQRDEEHAAQLRESIRTFAVAARRLVRLLLDDSPIILAASETTSALLSTMSESPTADRLRSSAEDHSRMLQAAVQGWYSSAVTSIVYSALSDLSDASERLSGELNMLSAAGSLVRRVADDAYAPQILAKVLSAEVAAIAASDGGAREFTPEVLQRELAGQLQAAASEQFHKRYGRCLERLDDFIELGEVSLLGLDARDLARSARGGSSEDVYTDEMRDDVSRLRPLLRPEVATRLERLVTEIELECGHEGTLEHARRLLRETADRTPDEDPREA